MADKEINVGCAGIAGGFGLLLIVGLIALPMWGCPQYRVYSEGLEGEAKLREAESTRRILIEEAKAKLESSKLLANAEVERARGVAEANKIIGDSLKDNHEYLVYLWIHELSSSGNDVIYVPTEAGLPILEAGRLLKPLNKSKKPKDE